MHPAFSSLSLSKSNHEALYIQLANQIIRLIQNGQLLAGSRLPSSRQLAGLLNLHRKTVVRSYDELQAQGWLESRRGNGTFVTEYVSKFRPKSSAAINEHPQALESAGFKFGLMSHLDRKPVKPSLALHLDDGYPDARLAPLNELSRAYRTQLLTGDSYQKLGYSTAQGSLWLREELAIYLNDTRGLNISADHLLITRGSTMGLYLTCLAFIKRGDEIVVGSPGWSGAETNFVQAGAILNRIAVDEHGLRVDLLDELCKTKTVRMVYITPHHHYPTTVGLRADRRSKILALSKKYRFIVFEDDYDFDFHYESKPLLPLINSDQYGMVLYCGSFTKIISPAFRLGYLVAPKNIIQQLTKIRHIIDRQGDTMLENAIAELLQRGIIQRHIRKSVRVYRERRNLMTELLDLELGDILHFKKPEGGMAVWVNFDRGIVLADLASKAYTSGLQISDGFIYESPTFNHNGIRLGFASSTENEIESSIGILKRLIKRFF